jgi:prepilin-type N-terminal cleavage/methylation domain-containing protein
VNVFQKRGFTLVEIMIVVAIIGLLAALSVPAMLKAGTKTRAHRFALEIKSAGDAFVQFAIENGDYPADKTPAQMPDGMAAYLNGFPWTEKTLIGGQWDWDLGQFGIRAGVSVHQPDWNDDYMTKIDVVIDDGNLSTGQFRKRTGGYMYILED